MAQVPLAYSFTCRRTRQSHVKALNQADGLVKFSLCTCTNFNDWTYLLIAEAYDWCIVPDSGYDAVVFAGVAVLAACCLQGKFSALWILLAGSIIKQAI